ncbi:hypothetical protein FXO38_13842 [Capsicum annuum]|nr:hypothetical protein FXO37_32906 [Capsicum annuum]KAF3657109.1 hypothetical protein FXO38_13842 [Capsicum annuum]
MQEQNVPIVDEVKFETSSQIFSKLQSRENDFSTPLDDFLSRKRKRCDVLDEDYGPSFTLIPSTPPDILDHISIKEEFCTAEDLGGIPYKSDIPRAIWNPSFTRRGSLQPEYAARVGVPESDMPHDT